MFLTKQGYCSACKHGHSRVYVELHEKREGRKGGNVCHHPRDEPQQSKTRLTAPSTIIRSEIFDHRTTRERENPHVAEDTSVLPTGKGP